MNAADQLMMQIGLQDYVTQPLKGIQKTVTQTADTSRQAWEQIGGGAAGLFAGGFAIKEALMPAIEMDRALGGVKSLGVMDAELAVLKQSALSFSSEYGTSATDFVNHSALMVNAFGKMSGDTLAEVTASSSTLASAMKSDAETVSKYMKTVYGNYKTEADAMGKGQFSALIAGMTAEANNLYGIGMDEVEAMMDGMHSLTSTLGVDLSEQLAVFGMLRGQMSDGDAVTQYTNFLEGAAAAQDKLGVSFTDSAGNLLPMIDILNNVESLIGGMTGLEARTLLDDAGLGDGSLMLINLLKERDRFAQGLGQLNSVSGLDPATVKAEAMIDQQERLTASWYAIRAGAFGLVLPAINTVAGAMADGLTTLLGYTQAYPTLTSYAGYLALAVAGGAGVMGAYNLVVGSSRLVHNALKAPLLFTRLSVLSLNGAYSKAKWSLWSLNYAMLKQGVYANGASIASKAYAISTLLINKALVSASMGMKAFGLTALKSAAMMMVNPIFWIPAAIAAVGVAAYGLISNWDAMVNTLSQWYVFQKIGEFADWLGMQFDVAFSHISGVWQGFVDSLASVPLFAYLADEFSWMIARATGVFQGIAMAGKGAWQLIGASVQWMISPITMAWTLAKGFFTLLKEGPAAALQVLGVIPEQFSAMRQSLTSGFGLVYNGIAMFITSALDVIKSPFAIVGDGIDWLIDKINLIPGIDITSEVHQPTMPEFSQFDYQKGMAIPAQPFEYSPSVYQPQMDAPNSVLPIERGQGQYERSNGIAQATHPYSYDSQVKQPYLNNIEVTPPNVVMQGAPAYPVIEPMKPQGYAYHSAAYQPTVNTQDVEQKKRLKDTTRPISNYLSGGNEQQSVTNYITQASGKGYTDNSKNMHTGDIVIKQEAPFTPSQLAEWQELATP
ncbi:phage tail tape measure protein [Vibrio alfacsensis]|uniref:phage tail tape measure protein n=1 Tax=Vibrio alfacsensis TaxID=1074311 RepID=UPI002ADDB886|nr:phage tail tape measure protein [Vibrio alfacsensis]WQE78038.1 phage tail tape measure protein [Vibrio alfacsensis]